MEDSSPERRNLLVTSIAFIAYFYAGGHFPNSTVNLQVINADFTKPEVLGFMAWLAFAWFFYRYWLVHRGIFFPEFRKEFTQWQSKQYIFDYARKSVDHQLVSDEKAGSHIRDIFWHGGFVNVEFMWAGKVTRAGGDSGRIRSHTDFPSDQKLENLHMTDFKGWALALRATSECMFEFPSFSNYIVPYILAFIAIVGALK